MSIIGAIAAVGLEVEVLKKVRKIKTNHKGITGGKA